MTGLDVDPDRAAKAARALRDGGVEVRRDGRRSFSVSSFSGDETYRVTLGSDSSCTCPDHSIRREACKHQLAALYVVGLNNGGGR